MHDSELEKIRAYWKRRIGVGAWLGEDVCSALARRYVDEVKYEDLEDFDSIRDRGVIYAANHQVGVESLMFGLIAAALQELPVSVLAKSEHRESWIGRLFGAAFSREDLTLPKLLVLVDRDDARAMVRTFATEFELAQKNEQSFLIHVEGTRSLQCRRNVSVVSGPLVDRAVRLGVPIVPVRFKGALPVEPLDERLEFPHRHGRQQIWIGRALRPDTLEPLPSADRKARVLEALAELGGDWSLEEPHPGDPEFIAKVTSFMKDYGVDEASAVQACSLEELPDASDDARVAMRAVRERKPIPEDYPHREWLALCCRAIFGYLPGT